MQKIVYDSAAEVYWDVSINFVERAENELKAKVAAGGMELHYPKPEDVEAWRKISKPAWDKFLETAGETGQKLLDIAEKTR